MFRIGEFSKITHTPVSQLRYYDRIDLFKPAFVDPQNDYRYYSAKQLPRLNHILALKDLGFSIESIQHMVDDSLGLDEIKRMLSLRRAQIEQTLTEELLRLRRVEIRLRMLEQGERTQENEVVIKAVPPQNYFSMRQTVHTFLEGSDMAKLVSNTMNNLLPEALTARCGPCVFVIHSPAFNLTEIDLEVGFLLDHRVSSKLQNQPTKNIQWRVLPAVPTTASIAHVGSGEEAFISYGDLGSWIEANHYQLAGPVRELYFPTGKHDPPFIEIQFPVTQISTDMNWRRTNE